MPHRRLDPHHSARLVILLIGYSVVLFAAFFLAYELRFDFAVPVQQQAIRNRDVLGILLLQIGCLAAFRQFGTLLTYFSVPDLVRIVASLCTSNVLLAVVWYATAGLYAPPRGVLLADLMFALGGLCLFRLSLRMYRERYMSGADHDLGNIKKRRVVILGAGDVGARLAQDAASRPRMGLTPVCFLDDDRTKHGHRIHGVTVAGTPEDLVTIARMQQIEAAIIAMPSASAKRVREMVALAQAAKLKVETVPSTAEITSGRVQVSKIRPVDVEDLLGRDPVELDGEGIRKSIQGRVALVTGAGGSIGSELCRQIAALAPKQLLLVEQSEGALFLIEQELNELGLGSLAVPLVGDILDEERMRYIFSHYKPEVVFHAAAHKHVFLMERQPAEAIRNNVLGTRLLAEIAVDHGVDRFVMISTDKAINPTNVMGATKRLAELQVMAIAAMQSERQKAEIAKSRNSETFGISESRQVEVSSSAAAADATHEAAAAILRAVSRTGKTEMPKSGNTEIRSPEDQKSEKPRAIGFGVTSATVSGAAENVGVSESRPPNRELSSFGISEFRDFGISRTSFRRNGGTKFMAVRFGNVLGSSGSVIPIFKRQIANGGPVTVTHPDVTRYFMTIPEAVGLVLQASILGEGGEIFVLDMGQPVKIVDLAKQMIELSGFKVGDDIEIKFTGLKPGEKLFEELQHKNEQHSPTDHARIMRFTTTAMFSESGVQELRQRLYELDSNQLKSLLKRLVPEYTPFLD